LGGNTRMKVDLLLFTFVALVVIYSLAWLAVYRALTTKKPAFTRVDATPLDTTTPGQRARGESSFVIDKGRRFGITRPGFFSLVVLGYFALVLALAIAFIVLFRSSAA
jgi:hypothetical protein